MQEIRNKKLRNDVPKQRIGGGECKGCEFVSVLDIFLEDMSEINLHVFHLSFAIQPFGADDPRNQEIVLQG